MLVGRQMARLPCWTLAKGVWICFDTKYGSYHLARRQYVSYFSQLFLLNSSIMDFLPEPGGPCTAICAPLKELKMETQLNRMDSSVFTLTAQGCPRQTPCSNFFLGFDSLSKMTHFWESQSVGMPLPGSLGREFWAFWLFREEISSPVPGQMTLWVSYSSPCTFRMSHKAFSNLAVSSGATRPDIPQKTTQRANFYITFLLFLSLSLIVSQFILSTLSAIVHNLQASSRLLMLQSSSTDLSLTWPLGASLSIMRDSWQVKCSSISEESPIGFFTFQKYLTSMGVSSLFRSTRLFSQQTDKLTFSKRLFKIYSTLPSPFSMQTIEWSSTNVGGIEERLLVSTMTLVPCLPISRIPQPSRTERSLRQLSFCSKSDPKTPSNTIHLSSAPSDKFLLTTLGSLPPIIKSESVIAEWQIRFTSMFLYLCCESSWRTNSIAVDLPHRFSPTTTIFLCRLCASVIAKYRVLASLIRVDPYLLPSYKSSMKRESWGLIFWRSEATVFLDLSLKD